MWTDRQKEGDCSMSAAFSGTKLLISLAVGAVFGVVLSGVQLSCGTVQKSACAAEECPTGPVGPVGPPGPAGPGFGTCVWYATGCPSGQPGQECVQICPDNTHPIAGSCDITAGGEISEDRASVDSAKSFPIAPAPFTAFDRWVCEAASGTVQGTYVLCCPS